MWVGALRPLLEPCSSRQAARVLQVLSPIRSLSTSGTWPEVKTEQPKPAATPNVELAAPAVYVSESNDPWFNLSYEDWLLRNTPKEQPVLFFYRNLPCVVLGRNQNPWKETTPRLLREWKTPLVRRRSGGGTVYHIRADDQDMGNTNFSIILPRLLFTREHGAQLVAKAVRERMGVKQCTVNERNDVIIRDQELGKDFKVSGSAYKIIQHRAYHHGTMLISSSVAQLGKALKSDAHSMETKGIASYRSPVTTLNTYRDQQTPALGHDDFVKAVTDEFAAVYADDSKPLQKTILSDKDTTDDKLWKGVDELQSWQWTYGSSPEFTYGFEGALSIGRVVASLSSRQGLITEISLKSSSGQIQEYLDAVSHSLVGKRYETLEGAEDDIALLSHTHAKLGEEIIDWLRLAM